MKQFTVVFPIAHREDNNYILLGEQREGKPLAGYLNGYGGKVEPTDESLLAAASRELREELGIDLDNPVYIGSIIHQSKEVFFYLSTTPSIDHGDTDDMIHNTWFDITDNYFIDKMLPGDIEIIEHVRTNIDNYLKNERVTEFKIIKEGQEIDTAVEELNKSIGLH